MLYDYFDDPAYNVMLHTAPKRPMDAPGARASDMEAVLLQARHLFAAQNSKPAFDSPVAVPTDDYFRCFVQILPSLSSWGGVKSLGGFIGSLGFGEDQADMLRNSKKTSDPTL